MENINVQNREVKFILKKSPRQHKPGGLETIDMTSYSL